MYAWSQLISVCNSERINEIGQYLPKLCSNEKGPVFLTHSVVYKQLTMKDSAESYHTMTDEYRQEDTIQRRA